MRRTASQEIDPSLPLTLRAEARAADIEAVRRLVEATGFFSEEEEAIALELVEERLLKGEASGYDFLFAHRGGAVVGSACYGRIPPTRASYDLPLTVVAPASAGPSSPRPRRRCGTPAAPPSMPKPPRATSTRRRAASIARRATPSRRSSRISTRRATARSCSQSD